MGISNNKVKKRLKELENVSDDNEMDFDKFWLWFTDKFSDAVEGCDDYDALALIQAKLKQDMEVTELSLLRHILTLCVYFLRKCK